MKISVVKKDIGVEVLSKEVFHLNDFLDVVKALKSYNSSVKMFDDHVEVDGNLIKFKPTELLQLVLKGSL